MFKKILSTFSAQLLSGLIGISVVILTARHLGAEGRGVISILVFNISLVLMFNNFVGGGALVYLTSRENFGRLITVSYLWALISALAVSALLTFSGLSPVNFAAHLFLLSLINAVNGVNTNILIGQERLHERNISLVVQGVIQLLVFYSILQWLGERSVMSFIKALYASYLVSFVLSSIFLLKKRDHIVSRSLAAVTKGLVSYGFYVQAGGLIQLLNFRFSYYLIEKFHGAAVLGVYSTGISLIEGLWIISRSISLVLYARIANSDDADAGRLLTIRLIKFTFVITALCLLPLLLIPTDVYAAIFDGNEFGKIKSIFLYLAIGTVMFSASAMLSAYMSGTGQFQVNTRASFIGLTATVALGFWLIPTHQMLGAGLTASASYLVTVVYQGYEFCKRSGTTPGEFIPKRHDFQSVQDAIKAYLISGK